MLTEYSKIYVPKYHWAVDMTKHHEDIHWTERDAKLQEDVEQWNRGVITFEEKHLIKNILRLFTESDVNVGQNYYDFMIPVFKNNEVRNMLGSFAGREGVHQRAYALLNDTLGFGEDFYEEFKDFKEMKEKVEYMHTVSSKSYNDVAVSIGKQIFFEGVSLFSSFIMLMNFDRFGKMKGMCDIVRWSIRDESCFTGDVEILTEKGWIRFDRLDRDTQVAQYHEDGSIEFVMPTNYIKKQYDGKLINFSSEKAGICLSATEDHDLCYNHQYKDRNEFKKVKFGEFEPHYRKKFIVSGFKENGSRKITPHERFLIALQADGSLDSRITEYGKNTGYQTAIFSLKKDRKKTRLEEILRECDYTYTKIDYNNNISVYRVNAPVGLSKTFNWIDLSAISGHWGKMFIEELMYWDGHDVYKDKSSIYYSSTNGINIDIIQSICAISGLHCVRSIQKDDRKDSYKDVHRVWIREKHNIPTGRVVKKTEAYNGMVYCVSVPSKNIIVRHNNHVNVVGNCHIEGNSKLFKEFLEEHPRIVNDDMKKEIYQAARDVVKLEDLFIDRAFGESNIEGLTKEEVKSYIRFVANYRLQQLGLKANWKQVQSNPIDWSEWIFRDAFGNFFEREITSYAKNNLTGEWVY